MSIVVAAKEDATEVLECLKVLNTEELSCFDDKMIAKIFAKQEVLVYKEDGIIKGACSTLADIDDKSLELYALGVKPEYRGLGIGKKLVEEVERLAKEDVTDIEAVYVCSFQFYGVRDFYLKLGYTEIADNEMYKGYPYYVFVKAV